MALERIIEKEGREYLQLINPANSKQIFNPISGITGEPILINNEEEVRKIVEEAREAYKFWSNLPKKQKKRFFRTLKHTIAKNADAIAQLINEEMGKPLVECYEEVMVSLDMLNAYQNNGLADSRVFRGTSPVNKFKQIKTTEIPSERGKRMGVSAAITPWNYPFMIHFNIAARSLFYGNALVIKPSEQVPYSGEFVKCLVDKAWEKSGLKKFWKYPPIRVVQGNGRVGKLLVDLLNEEKINFLLFCGSTEVGRKIKQAVNNPKEKLELLLGGNDPFIILEDCDPDMTVDVLMGACLYNGGQSCSSTERVYIAESIADVVVGKVLEKVKEIKVGYDPNDPYIDIGPIMNRHQLDIIEDHIADAKAKGAKILFGDKRVIDKTCAKGCFIEPTVLINVNHDMKIMTEETFGPMIPIMTFKTEEEAIRLANDSRFGLTASVWTKDIKRGEKLAEKIEAGTVYINDTFWTASEPKVHWPGAKESGNRIDEENLYPDKVIAITKGNKIDKAGFFWLKKNTPKKLRIIKTLVKQAYNL